MRRLTYVAVLPIVLAAGCFGNSASAGREPSHPAVTKVAGIGKRVTFATWPNFHRTASKSGHAIGRVHLPLHHAWQASLDGPVWSEPVIANGILIAGTEHDSVYGLSPRTGKQRWHTKLGTAEPGSLEPCGDIDPIGITSSPAYDAATGSVFVVTTTGHGTHKLWALSAKTGHKRWHRNIDVDKARDPNAEQQRAALLVVGKRVIVTYGAHAGDCGNYVGYAASAATDGKGKIPFYAVPNQRQAGMWGPAGPVVAYDGNILTPTANGSNRSGGKWDHSDGVIELTPKSMHFVRGWAPKNWLQGDIDDESLGSTSPVRVNGRYVVGGKRGTVWLLKKKLGGVGHQVDTDEAADCGAFGGAAAAGHTAILPCKSGAAGILALHVSKHHLRTKWRTDGVYGSPIIAGKRVYVADLNSGDLKVLSLKSGHVIASISVGSLPTFPSEVVDGNHVFVPTLDGITAIHGS